MKKYFTYIWQFVSFLLVPQQGKHISEQAQSYDNKYFNHNYGYYRN